MSKLQLDPALVARARELAARAAAPVVHLAQTHTTVSVERAVLRLAGLTGTDPVTGEGAEQDRVPWVNRVVDADVPVALGSDAPVTPLDPWGGVHAAVDHSTPGSGLRPFDAFDAATHGGWHAARAEHPDGPLAAGAPAHLALWETAETLSAVLAGRVRPACRLLLVDGEPIGDLP